MEKRESEGEHVIIKTDCGVTIEVPDHLEKPVVQITEVTLDSGEIIKTDYHSSMEMLADMFTKGKKVKAYTTVY